MNGEAGKGSRPRPTDKKKFDQSWVRIFGRAECKNCFGVGKIRVVGDKMDSAKVEDCPFCEGRGKVEK